MDFPQFFRVTEDGHWVPVLAFFLHARSNRAEIFRHKVRDEEILLLLVMMVMMMMMLTLQVIRLVLMVHWALYGKRQHRFEVSIYLSLLVSFFLGTSRESAILRCFVGVMLTQMA
jgi:hypothetical protein